MVRVVHCSSVLESCDLSAFRCFATSTLRMSTKGASDTMKQGMSWAPTKGCLRNVQGRALERKGRTLNKAGPLPPWHHINLLVGIMWGFRTLDKIRKWRSYRRVATISASLL